MGARNPIVNYDPAGFAAVPNFGKTENAPFGNGIERSDAHSSGGALGITGSGLGTRLYVQHDANFDTIATVNASGVVGIQYSYDPQGNIFFQVGDIVDSGSWGTISSNFIYLFQGERVDANTTLYYCQNRDYDPSTGTWREQDPLNTVSPNGYVNGTGDFYNQGTPGIIFSIPAPQRCREYLVESGYMSAFVQAVTVGLETRIPYLEYLANTVEFKWIEQDLSRYSAAQNLYQFEISNPVDQLDWLGLNPSSDDEKPPSDAFKSWGVVGHTWARGIFGLDDIAQLGLGGISYPFAMAGTAVPAGTVSYNRKSWMVGG